MNKRPDIAIFIHSLGGGGAERVAVTLCNAFVERNKHVHLVVLNKSGVYWDMLSPKVEVHNLNRTRMRNALFPLVRYLYTHRPLALLCFVTEANVVGIFANLLAFKPSRVIVSERATFSLFAGAKQGVCKHIYRLVPRIYHLAERLVCVSQGVADDIRQFVSLPSHKTAVIYNPTIRDELQILKIAPVDHPWFDLGYPVIVSVGRLEPQKNYSLLMEAFAEIRKTQRIKLIILGEGQERESLQTLINTLGISEDVDLIGFKQNPHSYTARAAFFVLSSDFEGLPNVLIEALACGTPVISTDCKSGPREILEDGKYGTLVPVGDKNKLVGAMSEILLHMEIHRKMAIAFQQQKKRFFTPEVIVPQYLAALEP